MGSLDRDRFVSSRVAPSRPSTAFGRLGRKALWLGLASFALPGLIEVTSAFAAGDAAWPPITIADTTVAPGESGRFFVDVARTSGGHNRMLDAFVVVTRGAKPGPTLCLVAGIHGDELNGVEIAHRVYAKTRAEDLSGTLIAVPAVNMQGVREGDRYLPDRRDLNRAFPGNANGSLASRIAHSLYTGVIERCNALVDLHTGSANRTNVPQIRTDLESPEALALAQSFGAGVILHGRGPEGSLRRTVLDGGVPAVIYEAGQPHIFEEDEITRGVAGIDQVMVDLGMLASKAKARRSEIYRDTTWVRSGDSVGIFLTPHEPGDRVRKNDVLGTVTDPFTETVVEIVAPRDGRIIGMAVPQMVLPGNGLFNLGYDPQ